jgi:hypothetical protein
LPVAISNNAVVNVAIGIFSIYLTDDINKKWDNFSGTPKLSFGKCVFSQPLRLNFATYKSTNAKAGLFDVFVDKI